MTPEPSSPLPHNAGSPNGTPGADTDSAHIDSSRAPESQPSSFTVRIENGSGWVSTDDAYTASLEPDLVARISSDLAPHLQDLAGKLAGELAGGLDGITPCDTSPVGTTGPTPANGPSNRLNISAPSRAALGEAQRLRPRPNPAAGRNSTDTSEPEASFATVDVSAAARLVPSGDAPGGHERTFTEVLAERRSQRAFNAPTMVQLAALLHRVFRLRGFDEADDGAIKRSRPVPSAGARHPLVPLLLVDDVDGLNEGLWRLEPDSATLHHVIDTTSSTALERAWAAVMDAGALADRPPAVVLLAARFDATLARYPGGSTLVWRDAGAAMAMLALTATDLRLASCLLGTAGVLDSATLRTAGVVGELVADIGAVAVGAPATPPDAAPIVRYSET